MKYIYKFLPIYFCICIFVGTFSNGPLISFPTLICIIINLIYYYLIIRKKIRFNHKWIKILLLYSFILLLTYLIFPHTDKSTNHLILYFFSFFFLFIGIRNCALYIIKSKPSYIDILHKQIFYVVLITSIYTLSEFAFKNFLDIDLNDYFIQFRRRQYEYIQFGLYRTRGFLDESGHLSLFYETFGLLAIVYARKFSKFKFWGFILLVVSALLTTFSAFGYVCLVGVIIATPYYLLKKMSLLNKILSLSIIIYFAIIILYIVADYLEFITIIIESKLDNSNSMLDRTDRFESIIPFLNSPQIIFGYGPGSYRLVNDDGIISLYANIILNTGYVGLLIYISFLLRQFFIINRIKNIYYHWAFSLSFYMTCIHFIFLDNFYYPFFWIMLTMAHLIVLTQNGKCINYNNHI